jgi:hypothetical protein
MGQDKIDEFKRKLAYLNSKEYKDKLKIIAEKDAVNIPLLKEERKQWLEKQTPEKLAELRKKNIERYDPSSHSNLRKKTKGGRRRRTTRTTRRRGKSRRYRR